MTQVYAPWSQEQVRALNEWQVSGTVHPFTCAGDRADQEHRSFAQTYDVEPGLLVAFINGWHCPVCGYHQTWAHDFMFKAPPPLSFAS